MRITSLLAAACAVSIAFVSPAPAADATPTSGVSPAATLPRIAPNATSFTLDNGLQLIVVPDTRLAVVTHMVWYRAGAADEPFGKSGIAHFLEHLMFKGTERFPAGHFSKFVAIVGGQENAFTSWDYTAFYQRTEKAQLAHLMDFEADRMANLRLTDDVVNPEREVILEERRQVIDNIPSAQFNEQLNAALFQNHPYHIPIIGWPQEMRGLTRQDAIDYYQRHYSPNNAVVIVVGDVTPQEVLKLAQDTYGKVPVRVPSADLVRVRPTEPPARAAHRIVMTDPRVRTSTFARYYIEPSFRTSHDGTAEALDVLGEILSGQTGRVYRSLVEDKQLAANAGAGYSGSGLDYGRFVFSASPRSGESFPAVESAIDDLIADLVDKGVTDAEVARAKQSMIDSATLAQDNPVEVAQVLGVGLMGGLTLDQVQNWPERIAHVTTADVNRAIKEAFDIRRSATGTLAPSRPVVGAEQQVPEAPATAPTVFR